MAGESTAGTGTADRLSLPPRAIGGSRAGRGDRVYTAVLLSSVSLVLLLAAGALGAVMSGSGPTVFGVARSLDHARTIRRRVNRAGWSAWAVRTQAGSCIRQGR